jgi:hypothetical protein
MKALVLVLALISAVELKEDAPLCQPPLAGRIHGRIHSAEPIKSVLAVSRAGGEPHKPESLDADGSFRFAPLSGDAVYDLVVELQGGRIVEGIDLEFVDDRLERLAELRRRQLQMPQPPAQTFTEADAAAIVQIVKDMKDFMDIRRVLYIRGAGDKAVTLVELLRERDFHASDAGEIIWRIELWRFRRHNGVWTRVPNAQRVLQRLRTSIGQWSAINHEYYPQLSVRINADGSSQAVDFAIPAKPDASRGRVAAAPPAPDTAPHVIIEN